MKKKASYALKKNYEEKNASILTYFFASIHEKRQFKRINPVQVKGVNAGQTKKYTGFLFCLITKLLNALKNNIVFLYSTSNHVIFYFNSLILKLRYSTFIGGPTCT